MSENHAIPPVVQAGVYLRMPRPKLSFVWDEMLPKPGTVVLGGEPFAGKSHFALQLGVALARGERFGPRDCIQSKVLYMMLESDEMVWHRILEKGEKELGPYPEHLYIVHPDYPSKPPWTNIAEERTRRWMLDMVEACDPDVVIIDPYRDLHHLDEQTSTAMKVVSDALLAILHGRALIILHHMKKIWSEKGVEIDPILALRGSSQIAAQASAVWLLHGADDHMKDLRVVPRWGKRETLTLEHMHHETGYWKFAGQRVAPKELPPSKHVKAPTDVEVPTSHSNDTSAQEPPTQGG